MRQDHDGVGAHAGARVLETVVHSCVPRLQGVGEAEGEIAQRNHDVRAHLRYYPNRKTTFAGDEKRVQRLNDFSSLWLHVTIYPDVSKR